MSKHRKKGMELATQAAIIFAGFLALAIILAVFMFSG